MIQAVESFVGRHRAVGVVSVLDVKSELANDVSLSGMDAVCEQIERSGLRVLDMQDGVLETGSSFKIYDLPVIGNRSVGLSKSRVQQLEQKAFANLTLLKCSLDCVVTP